MQSQLFNLVIVFRQTIKKQKYLSDKKSYLNSILIIAVYSSRYFVELYYLYTERNGRK